VHKRQYNYLIISCRGEHYELHPHATGVDQDYTSLSRQERRQRYDGDREFVQDRSVGWASHDHPVVVLDEGSGDQIPTEAAQEHGDERH
jgi:hypothetical protein